MTDTILFQEPGVTIAYDDQAHTLAPYGRSVRPDGDVNHGFIDLRDRPELVHSIPEANASPGLQKILVALNRKGSRFMSLGCERGVFFENNAANWPVSIGSYTTVVFRDFEANRSKEDFVALSRSIWKDFKPKSSERPVLLELIVEPLKALFHVTPAFSLELKLIALGRSESEANDTFEWLAASISEVIDRLAQVPGPELDQAGSVDRP